MKKLAVIVLHGIGSYVGEEDETKPGFDTALRNGMRSRLGAAFDQVEWQRVVWSAPELETRQQDLIDDRDAPRFWRWLFEFVASGLGDASAHTLPPIDSRYYSSAYFTVQSLVHAKLKALEARLGAQAPATPVLAIAHSLGCHVLSCYAWDAARHVERIIDPAGPETLTDFQKLRTISGLIFVGCNLPLVTMNVKRSALLPMKLPLRPPALGGTKESAWLNFYEGSDPLGYRIAEEYTAYFVGPHDDQDQFGTWGRDPPSEQRPVDREIDIRSLRALTPFAHSEYYQSKAVLDAVAAEIRRLLA